MIDYNEYLVRAQNEGIHPMDTMNEEEWDKTIQEYKLLQAKFSALEKKHGIGKIWTAAADEANNICDQLETLDWHLLH